MLGIQGNYAPIELMAFLFWLALWEGFDYYIYNLLEEGWQIGYMTPEVHYSIWNSIHELYPEDIDYKDGVQNYLQYCFKCINEFRCYIYSYR